MWNNGYGYYPPMMRDFRRNYDNNLCMYYENQKVYYDNKYPDCLKDALKDLECKEVNISLVNGEVLEDVILDEVNRDYIAIRDQDCEKTCLIPLNEIITICVCDDIAKNLWGKKIKKKNYK